MFLYIVGVVACSIVARNFITNPTIPIIVIPIIPIFIDVKISCRDGLVMIFISLLNDIKKFLIPKGFTLKQL